MPDPNQLTGYLGAGVHAHFLDGKVLLLAIHERQPGESTDVKVERVVLGPDEVQALITFAEQCWPQDA